MCSFPQLAQSHPEFRDAITTYPGCLCLAAPHAAPPVLLLHSPGNPPCGPLPPSPNRSVFSISSLTNFLPLLLLSVHFPRSSHFPFPPLYPLPASPPSPSPRSSGHLLYAQKPELSPFSKTPHPPQEELQIQLLSLFCLRFFPGPLRTPFIRRRSLRRKGMLALC